LSVLRRFFVVQATRRIVPDEAFLFAEDDDCVTTGTFAVIPTEL
jgi:hypothetical protein